MTKTEIRDSITDLLSKLDTRERMEMLANLMISQGFLLMGTPDAVVTPQNVFETIMRDRDEHGETLGNAFAMQGLLMLQWLE